MTLHTDGASRSELAALQQVAQTVLLERQGRDRSRWKQMRAQFHDDSTVQLSWFDGTGPDFVTGSEAMVRRGTKTLHRLGPPIARVHGARALVEVTATVVAPMEQDGKPVELRSYARLNYRLEDVGDGWKIRAIRAVYEFDELVGPGARVVLEKDERGQVTYRASYRQLSRFLALSGYVIPDDLLGEDRPAELQAFIDGEEAWLTATEETPTLHS